VKEVLTTAEDQDAVELPVEPLMLTPVVLFAVVSAAPDDPVSWLVAVHAGAPVSNLNLYIY